jgi:hypothetical protein
MNCLYCNSKSLTVTGGHSVWCTACPQNYNVENVVSTFGSDDEKMYLHMYIKKDNEFQYHVRIQYKSNDTYIGLTDHDEYGEYIAIIPGISLNPSNVKDKLKTYLTFL